MEAFEEAIELMPARFQGVLRSHAYLHPEELRAREGRRVSIVCGGGELELGTDGVAQSDIRHVLSRATGASLYSAAEKLRQGYFCTGRLRIGVCGRASGEGRGTGFSEYLSLCIRIAHECRGVCADIAAALTSGGFENTLILSPPGGGKTTALRDVVRCMSDAGARIGVIDERDELRAGGYDLGRCSDVISGTDKLSSALLLLRSMTPQIVAMDEITAPEDISAAEEVFGCGVGILATAHASDELDLARRESYRRLCERGIFRRAVVISQSGGKRRYDIRSVK